MPAKTVAPSRHAARRSPARDRLRCRAGAQTVGTEPTRVAQPSQRHARSRGGRLNGSTRRAGAPHGESGEAARVSNLRRRSRGEPSRRFRPEIDDGARVNPAVNGAYRARDGRGEARRRLTSRSTGAGENGRSALTIEAAQVGNLNSGPQQPCWDINRGAAMRLRGSYEGAFDLLKPFGPNHGT
jgi:hypothetical protein